VSTASGTEKESEKVIFCNNTCLVFKIDCFHILKYELRNFIVDAMMFDEESLNGDLPTIPLTAVLHCTNNFSEASKLGEGGFGPVYKVLMIWSL